MSTVCEARGLRISSPYPVLAILTLVVVVNYFDRYILSILVEPIRHELGLSDTQIGLLTGAGFALLYSTMAIPIARVAERRNRIMIVALAVAIWSAATCLCGLASSFILLFMARVMVGCGEAAAIAPSQSMVSDLFPVNRRGAAMSFLAMGTAAGGALAPVLGGILQNALGWRMTFMVVGLAGLPLALLLMMAVREPRRGMSDGLVTPAATVALWPSLVRLFRRRSYSLLVPALSLMALGEYSMIMWMPAFFQRSFGIPAAELGARIALFQGLPFLIGTFAGGWLADKLSLRDERWIAWVPMIGAALNAPAVICVFVIKTPSLAFALLILPSFVNGLYLAPCYALMQNLAAVHSRATATGVLVFAVNLIGAGLGPLLLGALSDVLHAHFGEQSLRYAFFSLVPIYVAAAVVFALIAAPLKRDLADARADSLQELSAPGSELQLD
jgi:MFS transporter, Spinster family, sphingosine-1-phosphate transporter